MADLWSSQQNGILLFLSALLFIVLTNLVALRRLGSAPHPARWPRVSVLLPARNEALNIEPCVRSLLAQDYSDLELIVLDDQSDDGTGDILASLASEDPRMQVLDGRPVPPGWLGKHWACHQLAAAADGELLLFTDADTRHHPWALRDAVAALLAEEAGLVSALPRQQVVSWAERLLVPVIPWSILTFVPVPLVHHTPVPAFAAAIGQFMLFRRDAYCEIGGHAAIRNHAADDLALARSMKAHGHRLRLLDGGDRVHCRMYRSWHEVFDGLSKNLFPAFDYHVAIFLFVWIWLGVVFLLPPLFLAVHLLGQRPGPRQSVKAMAAVGASLLLWGTVYRRLRFPLYLVLLYPVTIALAVTTALRSLFLTLSGRAVWKGRYL